MEINLDNFDFESLRDDLINYYGTVSSIYPQALIEVEIVRKASYEQLITIALDNNFNLEDYYLYKIK